MRELAVVEHVRDHGRWARGREHAAAELEPVDRRRQRTATARPPSLPVGLDAADAERVVRRRGLGKLRQARAGDAGVRPVLRARRSDRS